jgi:hypothetical protein
MDSLYSNATVQATYIIRQWWDSQDEIISADDRCRVRDEPDMALYSSAFRLIVSGSRLSTALSRARAPRDTPSSPTKNPLSRHQIAGAGANHFAFR